MRAAQRGDGLLAVVGIQQGLGVKNHVGLQRLGQHGGGVLAALARDRAGQVAADGVAAGGQEAELAAGQVGHGAAVGGQGRGLGAGHGQIAHQHGGVGAGSQAGRDLLGVLARGDRGELGRHGLFLGLGQRDGHFGQRARQFGGSHGNAGGHGHQRIVRDAVDHQDLRAALGGLAQALRHQRMVLAQERTHDQDAVQVVEFGDRHAQPRRARQGGVEGRVGLAQAEVDVFRTQRADQAAQQRVFFGGGVFRGQRADLTGAEAVAHPRQALGHGGQRVGPGGFLPLAVGALDHRGRQAVFAVQAFIREAIAVGDPAFVDGFVFERHHAHDAVALDLDHQVGAQTVVRADRTAARQLPGAGAVAERLGGQRAHRTDVDHVAGELGLDRTADEGRDLGVLAAVEHAQLHDAGDFLAEAHAAGAVDAAAHFLGGNQRAQVLVEDHALFLVVARGGGAVAHGQVLQLAFAALIADRAVERVIDEQEFHHRLLSGARLLGAGVDDHAIGHGRGAGGQRLGRLFHFNQAHAAVGRDGQFLVVAEMRHVKPDLLGGMHDHAAFGHFDLVAVDG